MGKAEMFLIAFGLSADAFALSVCNLGVVSEGRVMGYGGAERAEQGVDVGVAVFAVLMFGLLQGIMLYLGHEFSGIFDGIIRKFSEVLSMLLLVGLGIKGIVDGVRRYRKPALVFPTRRLSYFTVILQGFTVSVDAGVAGTWARVIGCNILEFSVITCVVTLFMCVLGSWLGKRFGYRFGDKFGIYGGIVLVLIGIKSLF